MPTLLKKISIFWKLSVAFALVIVLVLLSHVVVDFIFKPASTAVGQDVLAEKIEHRPVIATLLIILFILVLSGSAAWVFSRLFIRQPVRRLSGGMSKLANKEFDFRLEEDEKDEFGSLSSSFNDMAGMLSASLTELKKNRDYLEGILESSADIIMTVTASGKIQTINTGAENTLGYRRMDVICKPIEILLADPYEREVAAEKLKFAESVVNYEVQFLTHDKEVRDVLVTLSRLHNPNDEVIGTIVIGKDITEEKDLQNQLMQSQRYAAIGQVFTGIQHSMKNMLNACKGGAYMVRTGLAKDKRKMLVEGWEIVEEGINSLTGMSLDMLKYVKEWKPKLTRVDLAEVVAEIFRVIKPTAADKGVQFRLALPDKIPTVLCDARMIHSAALDIVSNALDACLWKDYEKDEVPEVVIGVHQSRDGQEAVIEVTDNGCGMTDEVKANIFTPFFSTKSKAGTGLGLSITSRMIGVHGGKIDVESTPDVGTVFRIVLPIDGTDRSKEMTDAKKGSGS